MIFWLMRLLLGKRKPKPVPTPIEAPASYPTPSRPKFNSRSEWEAVLLESMERNSLAPTDEIILHAFDLYKEDLYGPVTRRRREMADLYCDIIAGAARLKALAPGPVERAMSRHPFELPHTIEHKEGE